MTYVGLVCERRGAVGSVCEVRQVLSSSRVRQRVRERVNAELCLR